MKVVTKFHSIDCFETQRLVAKRIHANDLDKLLLMHEDPVVMKTLGGIRTHKETNDNLSWNLDEWQQNGFGFWMFYLKNTDIWIGRGGIRRVIVNDCEEVEVGYALMPAFWHQGYATEIALASVEIAFEILRLQNLVAFTLTTNKASQHVMEKVGFKYERDFTHANLPHVLYRLYSDRTANLVAYDESWPNRYRLEADKIQSALGDLLMDIHHMGSTAIPHMPAKPVIDILLECDNFDQISTIQTQLQTVGYAYLRRSIIPYFSFFTSNTVDDLRFHIHIYERGDPQIQRHIHFRDYLRQHPEDAQAYRDLKLKLSKLYIDDMHQYVQGKDQFVQTIDMKAKCWPNRRKQFLPSHKRTFNSDQNTLIKAMEANLNVHMTYFAQYLNQVTLIRIPGYTIVNSGLNDDTFNYVLDTDLIPTDADTKIKEVTDYFRQHHKPFSWWLSPNDKPNDLATRLENNGYQNTENNVAMYLNLDNWDHPSPITAPKSELTIIRALDEKTLTDFASVLTNDEIAFKTYFSWIAKILTDDDPIEYYVGYVNDKPVVRGLICFYAGVAGLYWLSTALDARHQGYATAMQHFRLTRAKQLGYHLAELQASVEGYPLYKKLGYQECGVFREYKCI